MTHDDVQRWLERYVAAWDTYEPAAIGDAVRRRGGVPLSAVGRPDRRPRRDRRDWLENKDEPASWAAHYDVWAFDGERASAIGESRYKNPDGTFRALYHNHFALRFDGHGKCVEFVEYYMELPEKLRPTS